MALSICRSRWVKGSDSSPTDSADSVNQPLKPSPTTPWDRPQAARRCTDNGEIKLIRLEFAANSRHQNNSGGNRQLSRQSAKCNGIPAKAKSRQKLPPCPSRWRQVGTKAATCRRRRLAVDRFHWSAETAAVMDFHPGRKLMEMEDGQRAEGLCG